jgi:hypothetical protein
MNQFEKAERFRALHAAPETFVIANARDAGSARILTALGFKALATSSGACAGVLGRRDGMVTRDEALAQPATRVTARQQASRERRTLLSSVRGLVRVAASIPDMRIGRQWFIPGTRYRP